MVAIFREANAFSVEFDVLVGGLLEVVHKSNSNGANKEVWRQAVVMFCRKNQRKLHTPKAAVCDPTESAYETA